jgi:signal transduction histidine kinase
MRDALPVWINEDPAQGTAGIGEAVELDLCDPGIVVLDSTGHAISANAQAGALLGAESPVTLDGRLTELQSGLPADFVGSGGEALVDVAGVGPVSVRSWAISGRGGEGHVLLLRDVRAAGGTAKLLQEASRHRGFAFLARDWAHDLKGMLHVIRINAALLARLLQRSPGVVDPAVTKCLEALPREVERLDRSIEMIFSVRADEQPSLVDVGKLCERLRGLIAARATRQRVEVVLEVSGGSREIVGFEDQVRLAILNVLLNALEAMPEQGRLVISADGHPAGVTVRVSDTAAGMPARADNHTGTARFVNDRRGIAIGLHVARAIVASHNGRIECASNVPRGTCVEITFPSAASTERLRHGSRTHR